MISTLILFNAINFYWCSRWEQMKPIGVLIPTKEFVIVCDNANREQEPHNMAASLS